MNLYIHDYAGHVGQLEVARALAARGHRVAFTYCDELPTPRGELNAVTGLDSLTIEPISIGRPIIKRNYFKRQWQDVLYARALARNLEKHQPQLVVSANNPLIPQRALVRHCRRRNIPVIHWWTDIYSLAVRDGVGNKYGPLGPAVANAYQRLEVRLLKQSQAILAIAEQFRTIADRWDVRTPITVIPVAAPTERIRPAPKRNTWSTAHGLDATTNVLYCGTLAIKHQPEFLLRLAQSLQNRTEVRVVVAAGGVGADWLRQQKESVRLRNLVLLPFQSFEDYANVLASAEVHITLLSREASSYATPSKVMSQLCAARPQIVIAPRDSLAATLVETAAAGRVFTPEEHGVAVVAIEELLANPERCIKFGENGRRYAEQQLSLESVLPLYEELFERAIASGIITNSR